jgi:hypothetical protein
MLVVVIATVLRVAEANPAVAQTPVVGAWRVNEDPGLDGTSRMWQSVPAIWVTTTPQQVTPPMGGGEVARIAVRALHWDGRLYVMLEWADSTPDLGSARPEEYSDAVAVQFPAVAGSAVPAICMGQADQGVNIWQWRADSQHGIPDQPSSGYVDLYPSTDELYYPARAAGNPMATVTQSVQNLVAGGFGTLTPADSQTVTGNGVHQNGAWMVVMRRAFTAPGDLHPSFSGDGPIDTAFAVWDGSRGHRDGIKSVSAFVQLQITDEEPAQVVADRMTWVVVRIFGLVMAAAAVGLALWLRQVWRSGADKG